MHEPAESTPYPPAQIWRFPPPPVSRAWLVVAILIGILSLLGFGAAATYLALNAERDIPGFIDDERVIEVAVEECRLMTSTVEGLPMEGSPRQRLGAMADQNEAVTTMVERIRELGAEVREGDRPLARWLADWETLVAERDDYLRLQRRGVEADFALPETSDGDPITERMNTAGIDVCDVPKVLLRPDLAGTQPI